MNWALLDRLLWSVVVPVVVAAISSVLVARLSEKGTRVRMRKKTRIWHIVASFRPTDPATSDTILGYAKGAVRDREELDSLLSEMLSDGLLQYDSLSEGYSLPPVKYESFDD